MYGDATANGLRSQSESRDTRGLGQPAAPATRAAIEMAPWRATGVASHEGGNPMAMVRCSECGETISDRAIACPRCGAPGSKSPLFGYEYRVPAEGFPLVHVAVGMDPTTGRRRMARGVIAVGDIAVGVVAIGGFALGGLCFGGVALGVLTFGGASIAAGLAF